MEGSRPIFHQESTAHALVDGSGTDDGNADTHDANSISQDAATSVVYEAKADAATAGHSEGVVTDVNMASISQNMAGYDSIERSTSEMTNYQSTGAVMSGSVSNDTVVYSAEEDRLWNMVRANFLDFNAWTALIEETEKVAEAYPQPSYAQPAATPVAPAFPLQPAPAAQPYYGSY